ncbi:MAG: hypothetical protein ACHQNA_08990, partial [Acidimicrobiales bacterium]
MRHVAPRPLLLGCLGILLAALAPPARAGVWTRLGPDGGPVQSVTFDPVTPSTVYATAGTDVLKSLDGGLSWTPITPPAYGFSVRVVVDPLTPSTIYVNRAQSIYKSTDGGGTWTGYPTGESFASSLAIDPINPSNLWIGGLGVVDRSTDGGLTWTATPLPPPSMNDQPVDLAVDPVNPSRLYGASSFGTQIGVYRSVDGGASYTHVLSNVNAQSLAIDPVSPSTVLAGDVYSAVVYRSTNGGTSWTSSTVGLTSGGTRHGLAIDPTNPLVVYSGGRGRMHKSVDGGLTWTAYTTGLLPSGYLQSVVLDPSNPGTVLGAEQTGVARSTDAGASWTIVQDGIRTSNIRTVTVDPTDPNVLYAVGYTFGLMKSTDGGATWADSNAGVGTTYVERVLVDPTSPQTLYLLLAYGGGILKSLDGGASWARADDGMGDSVNAITLAPSAPATLYAAAFNGVHKSIDGGASWNPTGLVVLGGDAKAIAVDPASADVVYAAIGTTVYRSIDGGGVWASSDVVPSVLGGTITMLGVDPTDSPTVYVGVTNGFLPGIHRSVNGGVSWMFGPSDYPSDIAFRSSSPAGVFVAGSHGVQMSLNRGATWSSIGGGLPAYGAQGVAVSGWLLYAGTVDGGVWRRSTLVCTTNAECDDADLCTTDVCDPGSPLADTLGCLHTSLTCSPRDCHGATCQPETGACVEYQRADNTPCTDDGTICTTDVCRAGTCVHDPVVVSTCKETLPKASTLSMKNLDPAKASLVWKWRKGQSTSLLDFGDPFNDGASDYTLCGFDRSGPGGTYALALSIQAPAGGLCGTKPCWTTKGVKLRYRDHDRPPDGADTLELVPDGTVEGKVTMTAKGPHLVLPAGPLSPDVRLQLRRDDDVVCWEATFQTNIHRNSAGLFRGK